MVNVTFNIDLSGETFDKVFLSGDFNQWEKTEITENINSIYSYTLQLEENKIYEYKFLLPSPSNLEGWEDLIFEKCAVNFPFNNRFINVGNIDINLPAVRFCKCD